MSNKLKSFAAVAVFGLLAGVQGAQAYTINDTYSAASNGSCPGADHCGGPVYDIAGANVSVALGGNTNVSIFSNFVNPQSTITYGDLFLTVGSNKFVLDTTSLTVYKITASTVLETASQAVGGSAGRPTQVVRYASGGTSVGSFSLVETVNPLLNSGTYYNGLSSGAPNVLSYTFSSALLGLAVNSTLDLSWTFTCANDIISGSFVVPGTNTTTSVPVPASGFLMLVGGLALFLSRRRNGFLAK